MFSYCLNCPINNIDPNGYWVLSLGVSRGVAAFIGINFFVNLLIDSSWDYGIFIGATMLYGFLVKGFSGAAAFYWGFKKINNYLKSITVSFGGGYKYGGALIYDYYKYPQNNKKFVGIQISYGTTGIYRETAPFDGVIYIPLKKKLSPFFKSCGKNISKLLGKIKKLKIKILRR